MILSAPQVCEKLRKIGLEGKIQETNNYEYLRVFATDADGVTQGRACIFRSKYSHFKWYVEKITRMDPPDQALPDEYYPFAWEHLLKTGEVLTRDDWMARVTEARKLAEQKYQEKLALREANPHPQGKRCKPLERPNFRRFMYLFKVSTFLIDS